MHDLKRSVYNHNCPLPNVDFFEMYYDLDEGYIEAVSKVRLNTLIKQGTKLPKGFAGSYTAWAKASVMKDVFHRYTTWGITWQDLLAKSEEFESTL